MFVDEVKIKLIAGKGGDGCTSFRREKFIAMGGPNGGNGGKGASIIFKTDKSLKTLIDLKVKKIIKGDKGVNGKGDDRNGANAEEFPSRSSSPVWYLRSLSGSHGNGILRQSSSSYFHYRWSRRTDFHLPCR